MYPFTIYHARTNTSRRYTLYTRTSAARAKWHSAFVDAIGVRKARQDANKVPLVPLRFSSILILNFSGTDPNPSTTASSASLRALHLPLGHTLLVVPFVPHRFVGCFPFIPSNDVDVTFSVPKTELSCCRLYQRHIRWYTC